MYASVDNNYKLNKYFADVVQMTRYATARIKEQVIPEVNEILAELHSLDNRFGPNAVCVGSTYQGLKVRRQDEFDFSIPLLDIGPLKWSSSKQAYYSFTDPSKNDDNNLNQNLKIVSSWQALRQPDTGYCFMSFSDANYRDLIFDEHLIPFLVKLKFKMMLLEAVKRCELRGAKLSRIAHGPALTIKLHVNDGSETIPVSIDFSPIVQGKAPFASHIKWPRPDARWPSKDKIRAIKEIGVSFVAKKNFYWYYTYVECEKELVKDIDKDHQGCRKKVHRIMKGLFETVWSDDKPEECALSSYMLKNAWLWECERYHDPNDWKEVRLSERFISCIRRLKEFIRDRNLPQYFNANVNLRPGKDINKLMKVVNRIQDWPNELES